MKVDVCALLSLEVEALVVLFFFEKAGAYVLFGQLVWVVLLFVVIVVTAAINNLDLKFFKRSKAEVNIREFSKRSDSIPTTRLF